MNAQISLFDEIIVDNFAGGGGASTGIELALGRPVTIAINHDPAAILMHKTNHPHTLHLQASVWDVDPVEVCRGRPVGLAWFSPDCKHFSKAKGGPLVDRNIRGLSWVILRWAIEVPPRVMMMENVEEIQTWGPLIPMTDEKTGRLLKIVDITVNGKIKRKVVVAEPGEIVPPEQMAMMPDPERKGETFQAFIGMLTTGVSPDCPALDEACEFLRISRFGPEAQRLIRGLGYEVEYRELVAADYGAPTTRKRFVLVARCDGRPIVWPERTHAPADSEEVKAGKLLPWVSAASIIDWSLPMYSIFATKQEIKEKYGVNAVRPLADNTQRRIIRGVDKHTIRSGRPFIVPTGYGERAGQAPRVHDIDEPLPTVVGSGKHNLVDPILAPFAVECNHSGDGHISDVTEPIKTVTQKCTMGVVDSVLAPFTFSNTGHSVGDPADHPIGVVRTSGGEVLASASLTAIGQTGSNGDRSRSVEAPIPTVVSKQESCVVAANLIQYHTEQTESARTNGISEPLPTADASNRYGLISAHLSPYYGNGNPADVQNPMPTVTAHDREGLVSAVLHPMHAGGYKGKGNTPDIPVNTITGNGGIALAAHHLAVFKGQDTGQDLRDPLRTVTAQGGEFALTGTVIRKYASGTDLGHWPEIRALLNQHCGYTLADDEILLLRIGGAYWYISDITMRMLAPKELYAAMGFPVDYIIDRDYTGKAYPKNQQVARCGNAVCPPMARAVVAANMPEYYVVGINTMAELERRCAV